MEKGSMNRAFAWLVSGVALLAAVFLVFTLAGPGTAFLGWAKRAVSFPFELDYGEGPILYQATKLMNGHSFYTDPARAPYNIGNYPPLYHLVASAVSHLHQPLLGAGRLVSATCTVIMGAIVAAMVFLASGTDGPRESFADPATIAVRALAGVAAAFVFLSTKPVYFWGAFMRVDMLAVCLSSAGVLAYMALSRKGWWTGVSVAVLVLAAYTRQSVIAGALAVLVASLSFRRWRAVGAAGIGVAVGLAAFVGINAATGGQFLFHLITANNNAFHWETVRRVFGEVLGLHAVPLGLAVAGAVLSAYLASRRGMGIRSERRVLLAVYLLAAFLVALTVGKVGSSYNYLVESMLAMSVSMGLLLADCLSGLCALASKGVPRGRATAALVGALAASMAVTVLLAGYSRDYDPRRAVWLPPTDENARAEGMEVLGRVLRTGGPVLSEVMTYLPQAGKDIEFQPFELTQLSYQGVWDQAPLLRDITDRRFGLVMLQFDVTGDSSWHGERFTPEMVSAIRECYKPAGFVGGMWFYEPNE